MERSITVKAETIEEAVRLGLLILDVEQEQVDIELLSNPGRSLFGMRKNGAEVRMITKENELSRQPIEEKETRRTDVGILEDPKQIANEAGSRVDNNKLSFLFAGEKYPVIEPKKNLRLFVNNEEVKKRVIVKPSDEVIVKVSDELIPPQFTIKLISQGVFAMIYLTPGKKISRTLKDTVFKQNLILEAEEEVQLYNDINPQDIVDELKSMGVLKGFIFPAIKEATEVTREIEALVAKGITPLEGLDAHLELHAGFKVEIIDELRKVDYRDVNTRITVNKGQLIATYLPAIPGQDGVDLFGNPVPTRKVNDIIVRTGDNVSLEGYDLFATESGTLSVEWHGNLVEIDVNTEFVYNGEVNMKSGNIRFKGNLSIDGSVRPSMFVSATGNISISGTISKATIHAEKSIFIGGNVFSSTVSVGKEGFVLAELVAQLPKILEFLEQINKAIDHLLFVRGETADKMELSELNTIIRIIYKKRYDVFQNLSKEFIQKVKNHSAYLSSDWVKVSEKLYAVLLTQNSIHVKDAVDFINLVGEIRLLHSMYEKEVESLSFLYVPYAINSELYCKGDIVITTKGLYHSFVTAGHNISVNGVCRGGEVFAENNVVLHQSGSRNAVKTIVRTGTVGSIRIGYVYAGTEVYVGQIGYIFKRDKSNVYIKLGENNELYIG